MSSAHEFTPHATATWRKERQVLDCRDGELMTLLSLRSGQYHTLNALGAFIWERLETPASLPQLVSDVEHEFDADTAEVTSDVTALLCELRSLGLARDGSTEDDEDAIHHSARIPAAGGPRVAPSTSSIAVTLTRVRLFLRAGGVLRAARFAYESSVNPSAAVSATLADTVAERVNRAATLVPFRAECLERSLTVVRVLRRAGLDAKLRLAIRHYPFEAHAWAEQNGVAINECRTVCALYTAFPALEMEMLECGR